MPLRIPLVSRYLRPAESVTEALFGLIMVLTITLGAGLVVRKGDEATTRLLFGVLGCNAAWGIIDGGMYVMNRMLERSQETHLAGITPEHTHATGEDLMGALACFFLVVLATVPAALPFLLLHNRLIALRVSNALLLVSIFAVGYRWARYAHVNPWLFGCKLVVAGLAMVGIAMVLGG